MISRRQSLVEPELHPMATKGVRATPTRQFAADFSNLLFEFTFNGIGSPRISEQEFEDRFDNLDPVEQFTRSILFADIDTTPQAAATQAGEIVCQLYDQIPTIRSACWDDAIFTGYDPAAPQPMIVPMAYLGSEATTIFRYASFLEKLDWINVGPIPRMMTWHAHRMTGIDIHPGATIGKCFGIDHGTGIVIGETVRIGDYVSMYSGVVLGALRVDADQTAKRRHPEIGDDVKIYANATALGCIKIDKGVTIGANTYIFNRNIRQNAVVKRLANGSTVVEHRLADGRIIVETL